MRLGGVSARHPLSTSFMSTAAPVPRANYLLITLHRARCYFPSIRTEIYSAKRELWNFRSRERKYHGMELSLPGTFVPWNFRSRERVPRTFALLGTFAPRSKIPRTFAPTPSDFRSRHSFMDMYAYAVTCEF